MATADDKDPSQIADPAKDQKTGTDASAAMLAKMEAAMASMNEKLEAQATMLAEANKRLAPPAPKQDDVNLYEPQNMVQHMERIFDTRLRTEKQKDLTIYNLAQEYPEIQTDPKVRAAVLDAQKSVPEHIRDTAEGYELAVLKAAGKSGLVPKSQRKTVDDDVTYDGTRRQSSAPKKRNKVSEATLAAAELMGININDENRVKSLEEHANRDSWTKYR